MAILGIIKPHLSAVLSIGFLAMAGESFGGPTLSCLEMLGKGDWREWRQCLQALPAGDCQEQQGQSQPGLAVSQEGCESAGGDLAEAGANPRLLDAGGCSAMAGVQQLGDDDGSNLFDAPKRCFLGQVPTARASGESKERTLGRRAGAAQTRRAATPIERHLYGRSVDEPNSDTYRHNDSHDALPRQQGRGSSDDFLHGRGFSCDPSNDFFC